MLAQLSTMHVSFEILTSENLQRIAFYTNASQETFLGTTSGLSSLALQVVSQGIYAGRIHHTGTYWQEISASH